MFSISRDPPEGGTREVICTSWLVVMFPISRDPPEGGTVVSQILFKTESLDNLFPISRDPPEGGTVNTLSKWTTPYWHVSNF